MRAAQERRRSNAAGTHRTTRPRSEVERAAITDQEDSMSTQPAPPPPGPMMWIAYDPIVRDHLTMREQFNGDEPAWGESREEWAAKQGIEVPQVGDLIMMRHGRVVVESRRLERPEEDEEGRMVSGWYWTLMVKQVGW